MYFDKCRCCRGPWDIPFFDDRGRILFDRFQIKKNQVISCQQNEKARTTEKDYQKEITNQETLPKTIFSMQTQSQFPKNIDENQVDFIANKGIHAEQEKECRKLEKGMDIKLSTAKREA